MPRRRRDRDSDDDDDEDDDQSAVPPPKSRNRAAAERRRRKRDDSEGREEEEPEPVPMWKTVAVVVVVAGCFIAVYPKMFHPMLMYLLGLTKSQSSEDEQESRFPHPGAKHTPPPGRMPMPDRHMHQAPPPPMRMGPQGGPVEPPKGSSKAMWHWMLPFYTIGVIVFLLYTLGKIFWKQPKHKEGNRRAFNFKYNTGKDRFELNRNVIEDDDEEEESDEEYDDDRKNRSTLSKDDKQLKRLQNRLQETESAMHKILGQLEQLSGNVDQNTADNLKKMTLETLNNIGDIEPDDRKGDKRKSKTSPDVDSNGTPYIKDLEKALTDFKKFTENYIEEHTKKSETESPDDEKQKSNEAEEKVSKSEESTINAENLENGFDAMESEDPYNLTVEAGEGELINLENEKNEGEENSEQSRVRKRLVPKELSSPVAEE